MSRPSGPRITTELAARDLCTCGHSPVHHHGASGPCLAQHGDSAIVCARIAYAPAAGRA